MLQTNKFDIQINNNNNIKQIYFKSSKFVEFDDASEFYRCHA